MADAHDDSHGSSPAAWTGVGILLLATALICLGLVLANEILWIVGLVGLVVGVAAWVIMGKAAAAKTHQAASPRH